MSKVKYRHEIPNPYYFSEYTPECAYIAGFLMADGNLAFGKNKRYRVQINLSAKDICVLDFIKNKVVPNHNLVFHECVTKKKYISNKVTLNFEHKQITYDLLKLGIFPRKTGFEHIPSILPKEYWNSFILGFFDGDGSVKKVKESKKDYYIYSLNFTSASKKILLQIKEHLNIGTIYDIKIRSPAAKQLFSLEIKNRESIESFYSETYAKINHFTLDRKRIRLEEFINRGRLDSEYIVAFGEKLKISDIAKKYNINNRTLRYRLSNQKLKHLSIEEIINLPSNYRV